MANWTKNVRQNKNALVYTYRPSLHLLFKWRGHASVFHFQLKVKKITTIRLINFKFDIHLYYLPVLPLCFKHIRLSNNKRFDGIQVLHLRNVFSNTYMNYYKMNLFHIIYKFYIQWRQEKIKCLALWKVWRYQSGNQNSKSKNDRQQYDQRNTLHIKLSIKKREPH